MIINVIILEYWPILYVPGNMGVYYLEIDDIVLVSGMSCIFSNLRFFKCFRMRIVRADHYSLIG